MGFVTTTFLTADEERTLILRAQQGDREALGVLIANITPLLWKIAHKIVKEHPANDPEDLVQEGILKIVKQIGNFDLTKNIRFISYFGRVNRDMLQEACSNGVVPGKSLFHRTGRSKKTIEALTHHAGALTSLDMPNSIGQTEADLLEDLREPEMDLERHEMAALVQKCLERIPAHYRQVIEWKHFDEKTLDDIALILNCSRQNVRRLLAAGIRALTKELLCYRVMREEFREVED